MSGSLFVGHCYSPSAQNTAQEPQKRLLTPTMGIRPWTLHSIDDVCAHGVSPWQDTSLPFNLGCLFSPLQAQRQ